jgi:hypothetical protein
VTGVAFLLTGVSIEGKLQIFGKGLLFHGSFFVYLGFWTIIFVSFCLSNVLSAKKWENLVTSFITKQKQEQVQNERMGCEVCVLYDTISQCEEDWNAEEELCWIKLQQIIDSSKHSSAPSSSSSS